jgi:hypothetical protein
MHSCVYVFIGQKTNSIPRSVAEALAPFNEALQVRPYKVHLNHSIVQMMAKHYGLKISDQQALIDKIPEWVGGTGGVDHIGLFAEKRDNPRGKWDWYEIGGRWMGYVAGRDRTACDVLPARKLLQDKKLSSRLPAALVTPTGEWVEKDTFTTTPFGWFVAERTDRDWLLTVQRILTAFPDHLVVCVDVHS